LPDESVVAQFAARDPYLGLAINEIRVKQVETIIFISLVSASEAQWAVSETALQKLADTFTPLDTSSLKTTSEPSEEPVWELTGPASNTFGFIVPSDWETLYRDDSTVTVGLPAEAIRFEATTFAWDGVKPAPAAAQAAALAYLADNAAQYQNLESLAPTEFPLDSSTGATIDFLFTAEDETPMAGSVITAAHEGNLYRLVFTAPAQFYEGALQWFNPMYQSFRFLNPKEFIDEEEQDGG
jgi:hypothetical protein